MRKWFKSGVLVAMAAALCAATTGGGPVPARLLGTWHITRMLPTHNVACWDEAHARQLLGSTLIYKPHAMRWRGGEVPLQDAFTRQLTAEQFLRDGGSGGYVATFAELGIRAVVVTEVDLQHEDADITGATTEVPGDTVLLAGPNRIVVSACNVFYEAVR